MVPFTSCDDYLISSEANVHQYSYWSSRRCQMGQINPNWLLPRYLWKYGASASNPSKIRHSRGSLWSWCETDWILTTKFSKMSSLLPVFRNVLAGCRTEVVSSVSSLPTGIVMGMKFQLIETRLTFWKQNLSDVRDYASTNQWLMMNGCDHQPVQKNLSEAIRCGK